MNLISMTEFVINEWSIDLTTESRKRIYNYAKFLKQPLTLGMFVPCDEKGNVMNTNSIYDPRSKTGKYYPEEIEEAENKVLFEGFALIGNTLDNINGNCFFKNYLKGRTVEDLLRMNLTLTKSAIKLIGLK